jgi:Uma2 family endonuclease
MQRRTTTTPVTVDDYLAGEQESQVRHEYVDGAVYAMVGRATATG